jgi:hypothetical protein
VWLALALPSLGFCCVFAVAIARGSPTFDLALAQRLDRILVDVGGTDSFRVVVRDKTPAVFNISPPPGPAERMLTVSPRMLEHRAETTRQRLLVAALGFVHDASDEVLHGAAALQHAELRDSSIMRRRSLAGDLPPLVFLVVAAGATVTAPPHMWLAAAVASLGLSMWLALAAAGTLSRTAGMVHLWHGVDVAAAALLGDKDVVVAALLAMDSWWATTRAARPRLTKLFGRCMMPVPSSLHGATRAERLREHEPAGQT